MWIVIEKFGGPLCATIITDTEGNNKVFDNEEEVIKEIENLQDGIKVEI